MIWIMKLDVEILLGNCHNLQLNWYSIRWISFACENKSKLCVAPWRDLIVFVCAFFLLAIYSSSALSICLRCSCSVSFHNKYFHCRFGFFVLATCVFVLMFVLSCVHLSIFFSYVHEYERKFPIASTYSSLSRAHTHTHVLPAPFFFNSSCQWFITLCTSRAILLLSQNFCTSISMYAERAYTVMQQ